MYDKEDLMSKDANKPASNMSRRRFVRLAAASAAASAATTPAAGGAATTAAAAVNGVVPGGAPGVPDIYMSLPPVFKSTSRVPGNGKTVKVTVFSSGQPTAKEKGQNKFWQELEKRLGVTWDCTIIPSSSYPEKLAVLSASGDMGDLVLVDLNATPDQNKLIQQGAYTDLTPYLSGDALKEFPNLAKI